MFNVEQCVLCMKYRPWVSAGPFIHEAAVTCRKYCRYGVKRYPINQSFKHEVQCPHQKLSPALKTENKKNRNKSVKTG